ncbi:MAG: ATP-binding protein [Candidatus Sericytochromatia bacterium]|nr:ATP-binding protein [Candidatus Tanganyikabacteria bacterium]
MDPGRERARALLDQAWAEACAGKPVCVLVGGGPGSGKTSLLSDFAPSGGLVIKARAAPADATVPLLVAGQILAEILAEGPDPTAQGEEAEAFRYLLSGGMESAGRGDSLGMTPEHRRAVAFGYLDSRVHAALRPGPIAIVIDDLQWVDEASWAWLEGFCRSLRPADRLALIAADGYLEGAARLAAGILDVRRLDLAASDEAGGGPARAVAAPSENAAVAPDSADSPAERARRLLAAAERCLACAAAQTAMSQIQEAAALIAGSGEADPAFQARLLEARAAAHAATGAMTAAILQSRQRLALGGDSADLARAYDRHIGYLVKKGEPGQALTTCVEALGKIPAGTRGRTKLLARRAQSLLLAGRHQEALADCAECLANLETEDDPHLSGFVYFLWGGVEIRRLDLLKARSALENALAQFEAAGDLYNQAITLSDLGTVHVRLGEAGLAAECLARGLRLAERIADRRLRAVLLNNQGMLVHQQGQMAPARDCFARALEIHRDMDDQRSMGIALLNLGEVCLALGEREEADRHLSEALAVNEKIGAWDVMAETWRQIARLEGDRGDRRAALDAIKQGMQIAEQVGQVELLGVMQRLLAGLQAQLGNLDEALAAVGESIDLLRTVDAPLELGRGYAEKARLLGLCGEVAEAAAARAEAESLFTRLDAQFELEQLRQPSSKQPDG